jgi:hypothetical protein
VWHLKEVAERIRPYPKSARCDANVSGEDRRYWRGGLLTGSWRGFNVTIHNVENRQDLSERPDCMSPPTGSSIAERNAVRKDEVIDRKAHFLNLANGRQHVPQQMPTDLPGAPSTSLTTDSQERGFTRGRPID